MGLRGNKGSSLGHNIIFPLHKSQAQLQSSLSSSVTIHLYNSTKGVLLLKSGSPRLSLLHRIRLCYTEALSRETRVKPQSQTVQRL